MGSDVSWQISGSTNDGWARMGHETTLSYPNHPVHSPTDFVVTQAGTRLGPQPRFRLVQVAGLAGVSTDLNSDNTNAHRGSNEKHLQMSLDHPAQL